MSKTKPQFRQDGTASILAAADFPAVADSLM
jgi:hypothetical protein